MGVRLGQRILAFHLTFSCTGGPRGFISTFALNALELAGAPCEGPRALPGGSSFLYIARALETGVGCDPSGPRIRCAIGLATAGLLMQVFAFSLPLIAGGDANILYDLLLYRSLRALRLRQGKRTQTPKSHGALNSGQP